MARRRRRSKAGPSGSAGVPDDLRSELDSLQAKLTSAQAQAAQREQQPPRRSRRGLAVAAGAVTVGAGVAAGVLISDRGGHARLAAPISSAPSTQTAPATTSPAATSSATTGPPATSSPAPSPTVEPPAPPSTTAQPTTAQPAARPNGLIMVEPGQSFWSIAQAAETQLLGRTPTEREVTRYWLALIAANTSRLVRPGDPNLLYVGQALLLPPM